MLQIVLLTVNYSAFELITGSFSNSIFSLLSMIALGASSLFYIFSLYNTGWLMQEKTNNPRKYIKQKSKREEKIKNQNGYGLMLTVICFILLGVAWAAGESYTTQATKNTTEKPHTDLLKNSLVHNLI